MILEEYLEIVPVGKNCAYYKDLGYEVHKGVPIKVKIEDVSDGCSALENIKCDCCGKIEKRKHRAIIDTRKSYGKDLCVKCSKKEMQEKIKASNIEKYGVEYPMQSKEIKRKARESTLKHYGVQFSFQDKNLNKKARDSFKEKYGVNNPQQDKKLKKKTEETNLKRYGAKNVFANEEVKDKIKKTNLEKYGVEYVSQSSEIREKIKNTNLEKYGVEHPMQNSLVVQKATETRIGNDTIPVSKMQIKLFELCKKVFSNYLVELNTPLGPLSLDIRITTSDNKYIDIEYDGWYWHKDKQRDRRRDEVVKKYNYKIIRIRSGGLLPTEEQLKESMEYVLKDNNVFSRITLKDWKEPD